MFENVSILGISSAVPNSDKGISIERQTASDLAFAAVNQIFANCKIDKEEIGVLIFLSTTPDYRSPATALVLQSRLGINTDCISYDLNVGGCGFLQGLQVGSSLLKTTNKKFALVLLGDTPSKQSYSTGDDNSTFSDAGTAIILEKEDNAHKWIFSSLTKSNSFDKFILRNGGYRNAISQGNDEPYTGLSDLGPLLIDSDFIAAQQKELIPATINNHLITRGKKIKDFDFLLYDHSDYNIFKHIKEVLKIEDERTFPSLLSYGNTRGSFLPLLIAENLKVKEDNQTKPFHLLLTSFGEGLSITVAEININPSAIFPYVKTDMFFEEGVVGQQM